MLRSCASRRGQATTEYILIVVLVAILSIGIITVFGDSVRDLFRVSAERLGGKPDAKLDPGVTAPARDLVPQDLGKLRKRS